MSRTTRKNPDEHRTTYFEKTGDLNCYGNPNHRDKKPGDKPPGWFKRIRNRMRRHRIKQAMRDGKEIPKFKKDNQWQWT